MSGSKMAVFGGTRLLSACRIGNYVERSNLLRTTCASLCRNSSSCQVIYETHGDPRQVLSDRKVPLELPLKDNQVLVKMKLTPINPSDINMVEGTYFIRPPLPAIVGNEGVGEVVEVGSGVKTLRVGDWVNPADSGWGTWRTAAISSENELNKIANDIPVLGAATLNVNPCSAYRMLKDYVDLKPGDVVMQNSANSSVGNAVIQLAREWNLITVNVVRNRPDIKELENDLKALGANHVITEDYCSSSEMKSFVKTLPSPPKLALNGVGGKSATELLRCLGQGGTMVTYGGMSRKPVTVPTGSLIFKEVRVLGYWNTEWNARNRNSLARKEMIDELCDLMRKGKFLPQPCDTYPLKQYKEAVAAAVEGYKSKKVVLQIE